MPSVRRKSSTLKTRYWERYNVNENHPEREEIISNTMEEKLREAILKLGERWLLHPAHSPKKGLYNQWGRPEEQKET